jgi:hypothetical protein
MMVGVSFLGYAEQKGMWETGRWRKLYRKVLSRIMLLMFKIKHLPH